MVGYKVVYIPSEKKFIADNAITDVEEKGGILNNWRKTYAGARKCAATLQQKLNEGSIYIGKCIDCDALVVLSEKQMKHYKEKGYELPKRCKTCKQIRNNIFQTSSFEICNFCEYSESCNKDAAICSNTKMKRLTRGEVK